MRILDEQTMDTREAATYARKNVRTVVRWIVEGYPVGGGVVRLEAVRSGRTWLTSREAIARFLTATSPQPEVPKPVRPKASADASLKRWGVKL